MAGSNPESLCLSRFISGWEGGKKRNPQVTFYNDCNSLFTQARDAEAKAKDLQTTMARF
jgi:hypothetical protein